jgi:hypothetical protein
MAATSTSSSPLDRTPLADPIAEARRLVEAAADQGVLVRVLGSVAVHLQAPVAGPLLKRPIKDIDVAIRRGSRAAVTELLTSAGYLPDEMFNTLHGAQRLLFYDPNLRKLDVFVGEFSMCHVIPITDRLEHDLLTIPLAELLLTKLQIVQLNETDQRDIYNLAYHHEVSIGEGSGIEGDFIANLCAKDWGLWRTSKATIQRCKSNLAGYDLGAEPAGLIQERLDVLWTAIESAPKSAKWRLRSRVGDRVRWYGEPEEHASTQ